MQQWNSVVDGTRQITVSAGPMQYDRVLSRRESEIKTRVAQQLIASRSRMNAAILAHTYVSLRDLSSSLRDPDISRSRPIQHRPPARPAND